MSLFTSSRKPVAAKVVCVWGMHRSGTSALTGVLQEWGVFLGDVRTESGFNRKGNRENPDIRRLNDDVLKASGGSWHELPGKISWNAQDRQRRDAIIAGYSKHSCWGFKDPRLLFTLDGWLEKISAVQFIGSFRHPLLVARSLEKRNGFSLGKGVALWQAYNERLLDYHRRFQFPVISFDLAEPEYRQALQRLWERLTSLDLPLRKTEITFFAEELRHTAVDLEMELPPNVLATYRALQEISL